MQYETFLFGAIDIDANSIITFPYGIPGFDSRRFALIHEASASGNPSSFTLQSIEDPAVALQIADPTTFGLHYELQLSDEESAALQTDDSSDIALMLVLFKQEGQATAIAANLQAPLLINTKTRLGVQKVMPKISSRVTLSSLSTAA